MNVATAYTFGVNNGSMFNFERRNRGKDVDSRVGRVECRKVTGAIAHGSVHDESEFKVDMMDLGGWVEGVSINFVLAMSSGANTIPATLAAETATASEESGFGDDRISRPPAEPADGFNWKERLGSGIAKMAARNERMKDVNVDRRTE